MGKHGSSSGTHHTRGPVKNDAQVRDARRSVEQEGGFDWTPVVLLGVMGATALFSFDRAYQKYEKRKEEEGEDEKREKRHQHEDDEDEDRRRSRRDDDDDGDSIRRRRRRRRRSRGRSLDEWGDEEDDRREVDENGFYVHRRRGRSRGSHEGYDRGGYDRGFSVDHYDRYGGKSRRGTTSAW